MRNAVGVDRDQADRALGLERAELFLDARRRQAEAAGTRHADGDQVAVLGVGGCAGRDRKLAAELLLVDRHEPAAAARQRAEHAEHALRRAVDDLDDAAAVAMASSSSRAARREPARGRRRRRLRRASACAAWNADFRRRAVRLLVPFGRNRDQLAVAVAAGDVGERDRGQGAGVVQLLAAAPRCGLRRPVRAAFA